MNKNRNIIPLLWMLGLLAGGTALPAAGNESVAAGQPATASPTSPEVPLPFGLADHTGPLLAPAKETETERRPYDGPMEIAVLAGWNGCLLVPWDGDGGGRGRDGGGEYHEGHR